ncbi:MAG: CHAT domain-containing protein, partial [Anaerolineae bacterium]
MNTLEITIQRKWGAGWPVVVEHSQPGVFLPMRVEGLLRLTEEQHEKLIELAIDAEAYGKLLGEALFSDNKVYRAFVQARAKDADHLRVLLSVEAPVLKALHWERLCAPVDDDEWDFLALDQRLPFSLYLPSSTDRRFPPIGQRDLRALILVANPQGLGRYVMNDFDAAATVASVQKALGEIPCRVLAAVEEADGPPTLDELCERITAEHFTLLHIVAHGQLKGEETVIYLADDRNRVAPVTGTVLITWLRRLQGAKGLPHFAFLATCESAKPEAEAGLGGLAQRMVRKLGLPAVLAMTEKVSIATAEALAEKFYQQLRQHGEVDRALVEACAGLAGRYDITVPALYSRLGGRPLFSDTKDRELTDSEVEFGLDQLAQLLPGRAPVLREAFTAQAGRLRGMPGADREDLSKAARQEWDQALAEVNTICEEVLDLNFRALALGQDPPAYDARCPFRGLSAFRLEDREFFFGREVLIDRLVAKLAEHNFLAVLGPSGSGKSSLVLAGVIPVLQAKEPGLQMAYLTPGGDPLAQLEASLEKVHDQPAILVVDQFEELFTHSADEDKRQAFLDRLLGLAENLRVVITMRADFWGECAPYRALKEVMQARQELIAPMDSAELRRAMEMQAATVGLRFEADLSNTLLDAVQGEPGAMPLLQHALLELWKRRHGRWLRAEEYRAIGGVRQAIARTADDVYEKLSPDERDRVRDIFVRLTRLDEDPVQGEERRDTRRRVGMEELVP